MKVEVKLIDGTIEYFPNMTTPITTENYIKFFSNEREILIPFRNMLYWISEMEK
mgnify:CR=1 FL=1